MQISVIIPTYKPGNYLFDCLFSLMNQTFSSDLFEIIIVLNGCCNPYISLLNDYISENLYSHNVKLIQVDEPGVSNARNIGMSVAKGLYFCFIDDDDYVSSNYLQNLYTKASNNIIPISNTLAFIDGTDKLFNNGGMTIQFKQNINSCIHNISNISKFFSGPVYKLIHRDIISSFRFSKRFKNGEDSLFMFAISCNVKCVLLTDLDTIYYRRIRENSATKSKISRNHLYRFKNSIKLIIAYTYYYIKNPFKYNLLFYLTRLGASIKNMI